MEDSVLEFFNKEGIEIVDEIGQGGFGCVYHVYSDQYKMHFALKSIPKDCYNETEHELMATTDDNRIVRLYKTYLFQDNYYLLMELCSTTLEKYILKTKLNNDDIKMIINDVIACVKLCHRRNIAHCDIKPSNFLVDQYGRVKISDFGISCCNKKSISCHNGTKFFMAPELFTKETHNPYAADIWALGVTIYFISTKLYPFYSKDPNQLIANIMNIKYNEDLIEDPLLRHLISKCLTFSPVYRVTINELLELPYFMNQNVMFSQRPIHRPILVKPNISNKRKSKSSHLSWNPELAQHIHDFKQAKGSL